MAKIIYMKFIELTSKSIILRGISHQTNTSTKYPIILVHGYFSANRIGPQRLFVNMANYLAQNGYPVYRFDLQGMGESDGDISKVKFSDHVENLDTIINYVHSQHKNKKIILIAHCLGCNIALDQVLKHPSIFREIIFLAPFYSNSQIMEKFFGTEKLKELAVAKYTYRKGLYADYTFFEENKQDDFIAKVNSTPVTINAIIPENDQFIPLDCNIETFKQATKINKIFFPNADHNFLETQDELLKKIMELLNDEKYTV